MTEEIIDNGKMKIMLLQESFWKVEDKMNIILESIADQEADVIRLKRLTSLLQERLGRVETQLKVNNGKNE